MKLRLLLFLVILSGKLAAQENSSTDSIITLQNVIVNAYENNAKLISPTNGEKSLFAIK